MDSSKPPRIPPTPEQEKENFLKLINAEKSGRERSFRDRKKKRQATPINPKVPKVPKLSPEQIETQIKRDANRQWNERVDFCLRTRDLREKYAEADVLNRDRLKAAGVPSEWLEAYDTVQQNVLGIYDDPAIVALLGPSGTGKSHIASATINFFAKRGKVARYTTFHKLISTVQAAYGRPQGKTPIEIMDDFAKGDLLVIDEMQMRRLTRDEAINFGYVLDARYADDKSTILISNETEEQFTEVVGPSIASRIGEGGGCLACDWGDLRPYMKRQPAETT